MHVTDLLQLRPTLCDSMECSPPGSSVHGILQARILEWVAMPPSGDLPDLGIELASLMSPSLTGGVFGRTYNNHSVQFRSFSRSVVSYSS